MHAPGALLAALASHDAEALAPHLADAQQGPLLHGIAACAEAAWAVEPAAAAVSLAAAADRVHRLYPHRRTLKALVPLLGEAAFRQLMDPLGCCALSLAAALGHTATLEAMLDAGADPNPLEPSGRPMWHPLAAAAMAHDAGNVDSCGEPRVSEATAVQMCELLLSRGADVAACLAAYGPACQSRRASWLLKLHSRAVQRLLLRELLLTVQQGCLRPNFELGSVLLLLAAQADEAGAFLSLAAALPAGRLPAEYRQLAQDAVATARCCLGGGAACGSDSGSAAESNGADGRPGEVLRCMVQLAATAQQQAAAGVSAGAAVPAHFAEQLGLELSACLDAAALDGHTGQLAALLEAGVPVTATAVVCAVRGGSLPCLQLLLRYGIPPAEPLPADLVLRLPSSMESGLQYPCPVLTLLATHAAQGHGPLDPTSLAMAEALAAAGYRPSTYRHVLVLHPEEEQAQLMDAFEPALQDAGLCVHGSGRFLWMAATSPAWQPASHNSFPPAFRLAARELQLAAHRLGTSGCGCCAAATGVAPGGQTRSACTGNPATASARSSGVAAAHDLGHLPVHVLHEILQMAAYPLSTWAAAPWRAAAAWLAAWHTI